MACVGFITDENASAALLGHTQADNQPSNLQKSALGGMDGHWLSATPRPIIWVHPGGGELVIKTHTFNIC
jgi:hypothetical protein